MHIESKRMKNIYDKEEFSQKKSVRIYQIDSTLSNKVYFRTKKVTRDIEGHYIIIKESSTKRFNNL